MDYFLKNSEDITIISGGAKGADTLAIQYAKERGYKLIVKNAEWDEFGKSAGYIRNKEMAELASLDSKGACVAFIENNSRGTKHMIDLAKEYKLLLRIVEV